MRFLAIMFAMLIALGSAVPLASAVTVSAVHECCCASSEDVTVSTEHTDSCSTDCSSDCAPCCAGVTLLGLRPLADLVPWRVSADTCFFVSQAFADATAVSPPVPPPRA